MNQGALPYMSAIYQQPTQLRYSCVQQLQYLLMQNLDLEEIQCPAEDVQEPLLSNHYHDHLLVR